MPGLRFYFLFLSYSVLETMTLLKISLVETLLSLCSYGLWVRNMLNCR